MNWKRGLTRIYVVFWVLFALAGVAVVWSIGQPWSGRDWVEWALACLVLPAVLLWIIKWIAAGFSRRETTPAPTPSSGPFTPPVGPSRSR